MAAAHFTDRRQHLKCPHGGTVTAVAAHTRVKAAGDFAVARSTDTFVIAGCPFTLGPSPHPCVRVSGLAQPSRRSRLAGDASLTEDSVGFCLAADGAHAGARSLVSSTQQKGRAT